MQGKKTIGFPLIFLSLLYILNPTAGLFELLPDAIPFVGNIDETLAVYLLFASLHYLRTGSFRVFRSIIAKGRKK